MVLEKLIYQAYLKAVLTDNCFELLNGILPLWLRHL